MGCNSLSTMSKSSLCQQRDPIFDLQRDPHTHAHAIDFRQCADIRQSICTGASVAISAAMVRDDRYRSKSPMIGRKFDATRARSSSVPLQPPMSVAENIPSPHTPEGLGAASDADVGASSAASAASGPQPAAKARPKPAADAAPSANDNWWSSGGAYRRSASANRAQGQSSSSSWDQSIPKPGSGNPSAPWARSTTPRSRRPSASDTASEAGNRISDLDMPTAIDIMKSLDVDEHALKAR